MALVGDLGEFRLAELLGVIAQSHKTGCLTVASNRGSAQLFFEDGKLSFGSTAEYTSVLREGLLRAGKLTRELDRYIFANYRPVTEKGLALLLEEAGILSREDTLATEVSMLSGLIDHLIGADAGTFRFEPDVFTPSENVTVSLGLEDVVARARKRGQETEAEGEAESEPIGAAQEQRASLEDSRAGKGTIIRLADRIKGI